MRRIKSRRGKGTQAGVPTPAKRLLSPIWNPACGVAGFHLLQHAMLIGILHFISFYKRKYLFSECTLTMMFGLI